MKRSWRVSTAAIPMAISLLLVALGREASAAVYDVHLDRYLYGTLNQNDLPFSGGCAPSATTNALCYLQNGYPSVYGSSLLPTPGYSGLMSVAETLASPEYMRTNLGFGGTSSTDQFQGMYKYVEERAPGVTDYHAQWNGWFRESWWLFGSQPSWIESRWPTWQFIYQSLLGGAPVIFGESRGDWMGGHMLAAYEFLWNDANDDGIMQRSEGAELSFVDSDPQDGSSWLYWYFPMFQDEMSGPIHVGTQTTEVFRFIRLKGTRAFGPGFSRHKSSVQW
jgi:hypothetical protein